MGNLKLVDIMLYVYICVLILLIIMGVYQKYRIDAVYHIRFKWVETRDDRYHKYTFHEMCGFSVKNWFGFRYPKDKDFK